MYLSFTIAAGPRQRSHSRVRVPRRSWPYFTVSASRLHQHGGPDLLIHIHQERGGPVTTPCMWFPLCRSGLGIVACLPNRYSAVISGV
jgi:hypothetical protein